MVDRREEIRDAYDEIAGEYEALRDHDPAELSMLEDLVAPLPADARVLDAGCGSGVPAMASLAERVGVTGLDFSAAQLALASERIPGASLVQGDMTDLPFADATFDALYSLYAVVHVPREQHRACFAEFRRVVSEGAPVLVTVGTDGWTGSNDDWMGLGAEMHWDVPGLERTADLVEAVGFELEGHEVVADGVSEEDGEKAFVRARAA